MPRYFKKGTRLGWLERMMMDPSRGAPSHTDPQSFQPRENTQQNTSHIPDKTHKEGGV